MLHLMYFKWIVCSSESQDANIKAMRNVAKTDFSSRFMVYWHQNYLCSKPYTKRSYVHQFRSNFHRAISEKAKTGNELVLDPSPVKLVTNFHLRQRYKKPHRFITVTPLENFPPFEKKFDFEFKHVSAQSSHTGRAGGDGSYVILK